MTNHNPNICAADKGFAVTITYFSLAKITENYDDYEDYGNVEEKEVQKPATEEFDGHARSRRDIDNEPSSGEVTYTVCVGLVE